VADMVYAVADVVCGRFRLWPIWFVADIVVIRLVERCLLYAYLVTAKLLFCFCQVLRKLECQVFHTV